MDYSFVPALPDPRTFGPAVPPLLDLVGRDLGDDVDRAAIEAVAGLPGAVALWRSWRREPGAPMSVRVFVLETRGAATGFDAPHVEVYRSGTVLSAYTRAARNAGALLWMAQPAPPIRIARVFDVVDERGARFAPDHELLSGKDQAEVAAYLEAGAAVLGTEGRLPDVVEPARGTVVPMSYRTDGRWLWTESVAYYLRTYGLAPEPELLAHVRSADGGPPLGDAVAEHRALAVLFHSAAFTPRKTEGES